MQPNLERMLPSLHGFKVDASAPPLPPRLRVRGGHFVSRSSALRPITTRVQLEPRKFDLMPRRKISRHSTGVRDSAACAADAGVHARACVCVRALRCFLYRGNRLWKFVQHVMENGGREPGFLKALVSCCKSGTGAAERTIKEFQTIKN